MKNFWKEQKWFAIYTLGSFFSAVNLFYQGLFLPALLILALVICLAAYLSYINHDR